MQLMVVPDGHYFKAPNGEIYVESVFNYSFFARYLQVFKKVYVVGRVNHIDNIPANMKLASGKNVEFLELPGYKGPWQYLKNYLKLNKLAKEYSQRFECAIFRVPGATANIMSKKFAKTKKPFAVEVVVDPWDYFQKGSVNSVARPIVRITWTHFLKKICKQANGVSYVTKNYLQKKYPSHSIMNGETSQYFSSNYSSVSIRSDSFGLPKKFSNKKKYTISHVANSFTSYGKGHITLIKALKIVRDNNFDVKINFIGDGPLMGEFINKTQELSLDKHIEFMGRLSDGDEVRKVIADSDLFVFPTMAEGLPRVVLEAMSVGLPCISSPVSGIPEILSDEFLVDYNDYEGYANKIIILLQNYKLMEEASVNNIELAKDYTEEILNKRRITFYKKLRGLTLEKRRN